MANSDLKTVEALRERSVVAVVMLAYALTLAWLTLFNFMRRVGEHVVHWATLGTYVLESTETTTNTPAPDASSDAPIELYTSLTLKAKETHKVTSSRPIFVQGLLLWSATPIHISPFENDVVVQATHLLGSAFAAGWKKLATELKLRIVSFALTSNNLVTPEYCDPKSPLGVGEVYFQFLRSTPELAQLAKEAFYSLNTFHIEENWDSPNTRALRLPPRGFGQFIRRINVRFLSEVPYDTLQRLSSGQFGFEGLQYITVEFYFLPEFDVMTYLKDKNKIQFRCAGKIVARMLVGDEIEAAQDSVIQRLQEVLEFKAV